MLNKKLLAVAVAASFSTSALAAINLDATGTAPVLYSSELIADEVTEGFFTAANNDGSDPAVKGKLDVTSSLGFTINAEQVRFIRLDLNNGATFGPNLGLTFNDVVAGVPVPTARAVSSSVSAGGNGESFVIFEVTPAADDGSNNGGDLSPSVLVTISGDSYELPSTGSTSITYRLYETGTSAANPENANSLALKTASKPLANVVDTVTGEYATANNLVASVSTGFTSLTATGDNNFLGTIDTAAFVDTDPMAVDANGADATVESVVATDENYTLTLGGNISFGTFTLNSGTNEDCSDSVTGTFNSETGLLEDGADPAAAVSIDAATLTGTKHVVCVAVDDSEDEQFQKGSYSLTLESDSGATFDETIGNITFDTTSIEVPYLTTFADYNQRIILVNKGSSDASYSMTFTSEGMTTATAKAAASGSIPAGEMLVLRATDLVELDGRTRTSAVIEVEGEEENIQAVMQTVNDEDKSTDTVILNANSVTSYVPPVN